MNYLKVLLFVYWLDLRSSKRRKYRPNAVTTLWLYITVTALFKRGRFLPCFFTEQNIWQLFKTNNSISRPTYQKIKVVKLMLL